MENNDGYLYFLTSPNTDLIKIGGTDYPPTKRLKEINWTEPYKSLGPWSLKDFIQVKDWRSIEYNLHYTFRSKLDTKTEKQKELFNVSFQIISEYLKSIDPEKIINKPKIDRMFQDEVFSSYLINLFKYTGLNNFLNMQGSWTLVLFPSTSGGRYFTINIGPHEVAFSTLPRKDVSQFNMILVDKLIFDFSEVINWVMDHIGVIRLDQYSTALPRATSIFFEGNFEVVKEFLQLNGVRRALIAYWNEALLNLKDNNKMSVYSKYHNWNAVAEISKKIQNLNP